MLTEPPVENMYAFRNQNIIALHRKLFFTLHCGSGEHGASLDSGVGLLRQVKGAC